jgi:8-oxo-dGTP pyrophosphatase MutT (NUDIX family)
VTLYDSAVDTLRRWRPDDPGQDALRLAVLAFVLARPDACARSCEPGHVTASALVLDHTGTSTALTLHPRLGRWVQVGGHCEPGDPDLAAAALREAEEESGISGLVVDPVPAALHVHALTCSLGVPTHHLDVQFLARAPEAATLTRSDESVDLRWWPLDALPDDADFGLRQLATAAGRPSDTAAGRPSDTAAGR